MKKKRVAVLMGGPDAEREISIQSGTAVARALQKTEKYLVQALVIDTPTLQEIEDIQADAIFPALHGPFGEGGPLQQLLESAGKTFVGADSKSAKAAMDKITTKEIAVASGLQTPDWCVITKDSPCTIEPPVVLKPIDDGSSYDISICMTDSELQKEKSRLLQYRTHLLAEKYIEGRELTVGIIEHKTLPIIEIIPPRDLQSYDFEAKYERDDTQFILEPFLPPNSCAESALALYSKLGVRDLARVDFILNAEGAWLLEINTMPGFTDHSLVPMAAKHIGLEMPELCSRVIELAICR